jgi:hypothetical protein
MSGRQKVLKEYKLPFKNKENILEKRLLFTFVDFPPSDACSGIGQRPGHP